MASKPKRLAAGPVADATATVSVAIDSTLVTAHTLPAGTTLHRIHPAKYGAVEFNPGKLGNARFSPISTPTGAAIPTMYAGENFECAAMETIYHDVVIAPGLKTIDQDKLVGHSHSVLEIRADLHLADLRTKALMKLGLQRKDVIDTEKDRYPSTRTIAAAIHAERPDIQGLLWTSRRDDSAQAFMLFGDRVPPNALAARGASRDLVTDATTYDAVIALGEKIGVLVVTGH